MRHMGLAVLAQRAAQPFFFCLLVCIGIITVFPVAVTWLPDVLMGAPK